MNYFTRKPTKTLKVHATVNGKKKKIEIVSFLPKQHKESSSFGFEWARYSKLQVDRLNSTTITMDHLKQLFRQPLSSLKNKVVLEIGSGAGRYTDILSEYAKTIITVDPSAIRSNAALGRKNVIPVQADIFDLPIKSDLIDVVYCRGVLQHTKDPKLATKKLFEYVKPGGTVIFDIYPKTWRNIFYTKYYIRPFTRHLDKEQVAHFLERNIPWMLWVKRNILAKMVPDRKYWREIPDIILPIADYEHAIPGLKATWKQFVQWSILDTFDMYTPEYDTPLTFNEVMRLIDNPDHKIIFADRDMFQFRVQKKR